METDKEAIWPTLTKGTWGMREIVLAVAAGFFVVLSLGLAIGLGLHWTTTTNTCMDKSCLSASSFVLNNLNKTIDPCTDFFSYACSGFKEASPLPPDQSQNTVLSQLNNKNSERLREVLESPVIRTSSNSWERKIKSLFSSCINTYENQLAGGSKLIDLIRNGLGGWYVFDTNYPDGSFDFTAQFQKAHVDYWINALFAFRVDPDQADRTKNVIAIDYAGLGMYWTYYSDPRTERMRVTYKKFMNTVATLLLRDANLSPGDDVKTTFVNDVMDFETKLANITQWTQPSDSAHHPVNRLTLQQLNAGAGFIDWVRFFQYMFTNAGLTSSSQVVLLERNYLSQVSNMVNGLGANKNRILNNYLVWRVASAYVQDLSFEYVHANREFYVAQTGRQEFLGNWRYCFRFIGNKMQTAFGGLFVRDHFHPEDKATVHNMAKYLKNALKDMVTNAKWMDDKTRSVAITKVDGIIDKLGYPDMMAPGNDHMLDDFYEQLIVVDGDYFQNLLNMNKFEQFDWTRRLKNGVDKKLWYYSAYDIAVHFYNPWNNLFVPAGTMQFPLYSKSLPMYMNFGSLGTLMGHELIHSVDEQGGYYKPDGTVFDWWTTASTDAYLTQRQCVVDFYTNKTVGPYRVSETRAYNVIIHAQSYAVQAIAETYGVKTAYNAYMKWVQDNGAEKTAPGLGLTNEQTFFLAYGQTFCFNRNDIYAFQTVMRGYVPEDLRVNGALAQLDEFRKAFKCDKKAPLNPQAKCNLF